MEKYIEAKKNYAKIGVDTDRAIETLIIHSLVLICMVKGMISRI